MNLPSRSLIDSAGVSTLPSPVLRVDGVSRRWKERPDPVLDDVSLTLQPGEVVWVGGANGAGKTTLLRVVCGLLAPHAGTVALNGLQLHENRQAYYRQLGFLSAGDRGLFARLNPQRHLEYAARLYLMDRDDEKRAIAEVVELLGLAPLLNRRVDRLSLGQRQRVRIALAALHRPSLLVLDEPRNSLDDDGYEALRQTVRRCADNGGAVLWCSPRGEDLVLDFDRGYTLAQGRLQEAT